jgi:hypothetical protein
LLEFSALLMPKDFLHKLTTRLVRENQTIAVEIGREEYDEEP